jgi:hypothetical protein
MLKKVSGVLLRTVKEDEVNVTEFLSGRLLATGWMAEWSEFELL